MSFMSQVNEDELYVQPDNASTGATVGFMEGVGRSYEYGKLFESQLGVAMAMIDAEFENGKRIRKAGGIQPPSAYFQFAPDTTIIANDQGNDQYTDRAYRVARATVDGDYGMYAKLVGQRDDEIKALQQKYPNAGIRTYSEMFEDVRQNYNNMKTRLNQNYSVGGKVGWVVGGMAADMNPEVNPLSFWTMQMGGAGKNIAQRMATQGFAQGGVQAVEEVTGVRANKSLLGEQSTTQDSLMRVGAAALGGAGLQGVTEAGVALVKGAARKWFVHTERDPAPSPPKQDIYRTPTAQEPQRQVSLTAEVEQRIEQAVKDTAGTSRANMRGAQADFAHVARNLESWTGPMPWEVSPPTTSRIPSEFDIETPRVSAPRPGESVDDIARRVDPDTFKIFDKLAAERQGFRDLIAQAQENAANSADAIKAQRFIAGREQLQPLRDELKFVEDKIAKANRRKAKIYEGRRQELLAQITEGEAKLLGADPATVAQYRDRLMKTDEAMRDLAPAVSRAYARAQGKWNVYEAQRAEIDAMAMRGESRVPDNFNSLIDDAEKITSAAPERPTVRDAVPELNGPDVKRGPNETALDVIQRKLDEEDKDIQARMDEAKAAAPKLIEAKGEEAVIEVEGIPRPLKLDDEIRFENDDGSITVTSARQMLKDMQEDNDVLEALTVCSVAKTSANV